MADPLMAVFSMAISLIELGCGLGFIYCLFQAARAGFGAAGEGVKGSDTANLLWNKGKDFFGYSEEAKAKKAETQRNVDQEQAALRNISYYERSIESTLHNANMALIKRLQDLLGVLTSLNGQREELEKHPSAAVVKTYRDTLAQCVEAFRMIAYNNMPKYRDQAAKYLDLAMKAERIVSSIEDYEKKMTGIDALVEKILRFCLEHPDYKVVKENQQKVSDLKDAQRKLHEAHEILLKRLNELKLKDRQSVALIRTISETSDALNKLFNEIYTDIKQYGSPGPKSLHSQPNSVGSLQQKTQRAIELLHQNDQNILLDQELGKGAQDLLTQIRSLEELRMGLEKNANELDGILASKMMKAGPSAATTPKSDPDTISLRFKLSKPEAVNLFNILTEGDPAKIQAFLNALPADQANKLRAAIASGMI